MKKIMRLAICILMAINVFTATAFAAIPSPLSYTSVDLESNLCDKSVSYSQGTARSYARRGRLKEMEILGLRHMRIWLNQ